MRSAASEQRRPSRTRRRLRSSPVDADDRAEAVGSGRHGRRPARARARSRDPSGGAAPDARHSASTVNPPITPSAPITAASLGHEQQPARTANTTAARARRSPPGSRMRTIAWSSKTRTAGGCSTGARRMHVRERVLGVLARRAAAGEERLQRLRGELDRRGRRRSGRPSRAPSDARRDGTCRALTARCVPRRRRWPGRHSRTRSSIALARPCASASEPALPSPSVRKATMPSSVRTKRSSRGSAPVSCRTAASTAAVSIAISSAGRGLRRAARGASGRFSPRAPASRIACSTCSAISCAWSSGSSPGSFRWSETSMRAVDVEHRQVVDLAHVRDGERRRESALADSAVASARLDVDDDVDSRERLVERVLDAVGGGVPLADRRTGRDADDDVGEVLSPGAPKPQPCAARRGGSSPAIACRAIRASSSGERSMSTSTFRLSQTHRSDHDEPGHEERRDRVARRESRARPRRGRRARRASRRGRCRSGARSRAAHRSGSDVRLAARRPFATRRSRGRARSPRTSTTSARPRTRRRPRDAGSPQPRCRR